MPFSVFLALKYLRPRRSLASVITFVSVLGVQLGVAIVIIVRAVMTGFGDKWQEMILEFKPHVTVSPRAGTPLVRNEAPLVAEIEKIDGVKSVAPVIAARVLLERRVSGGSSLVDAPVLLGIDGDRVRSAFFPSAAGGAAQSSVRIDGTCDLEGETLVLGSGLAKKLGVRTPLNGGSPYFGLPLGHATVYSPKTLVNRDEIYLPLKYRVEGVFNLGHGDYDGEYALTSLANMRELLGIDDGVMSVNVKTAPAVAMDPARFGRIVEEIRKVAGRRGLEVRTWQELDRQLFNALAVEKNMMALLLMFITVVAVFCVMNTLLVLTVQKAPEIGLLKALGFPARKITGAFVVHGLVQCAAGTVLGLLSAWAVLANLQSMVSFLSGAGVEVFPAEIYKLSEIPWRLVPSDVAWVVCCVFGCGVLASLVPATAAARKNPVEALRS